MNNLAEKQSQMKNVFSYINLLIIIIVQDQDSLKLLKNIDCIVLWDHDRPIDPRKMAKDMNINEEELGNILDNVDVISYMWVNECADSGNL